MATTYAKDIRPLFRPQDIACMSRAGVRLGDAAWMCDPAGNNGFADHGNARHVYAALEKGVMPPDQKMVATGARHLHGLDERRLRLLELRTQTKTPAVKPGFCSLSLTVSRQAGILASSSLGSRST